MFNPKNFPILVKELSLVFGLRKARALVKSLRYKPGEYPLDGDLMGAFVWDFESKGFKYWSKLERRISLQKSRLREKRLKASLKK